MKARFRNFARLGLYTAALALGLGLPSRAVAQEQVQGATGAAAMKDLPLTAEQRQVFVGNYSFDTPDGPVSFRIFEENGTLKGQPANDEAKRLLYQGDNVFHPEGMPDFTVTFTLDRGRATKFTARRGEMVLEAVRAP